MVVRIRRPFKGARFIHPIDPAPRTAILAPGFRETRLVRIFPQGWNERAKRFDPGSIAGPLEQLRSLSRERLAAGPSGGGFHLRRRTRHFPAGSRGSFGKPSAFPYLSNT